MEFEMTKPIQINTKITMILICVLLVCLCVFFFLMFITSRNYKLTITEGKLNITSVFYNTHIDLEDIDIKNLEMVNYNDLSIGIRKNGIGMPGLLVGWFQGNGIKYKLYVTDKSNVLRIPTKKDYDILFSTKEGNEIMKRIKEK